MSEIIRKQLTLFLPEKYSVEIEKVRQKYNPIQANLIKSHVTLCREDEIENICEIIENLKSLDEKVLEIKFDRILRFSDEKGVLIFSSKKNSEYQNLRKLILKDLNSEIRLPEPHITLMHPRNSTCTNKIFEEITKIDFPKSIKFGKISFIEQKNGGKWKILEEFKL